MLMDWFQLRHAADRTSSKFNGTAVDPVASVPETSSFPLMVPFHLCSINTASFFTRRRTRNVEMQQPTMLDFQNEPSAKRTTGSTRFLACRAFRPITAPLIIGHLNPPVSSFCWIHRPRDHEPSHTRIRIKRCLNSWFVAGKQQW